VEVDKKCSKKWLQFYHNGFTNSAGDYIELAPDDYPYNVIKEVYIRERDKNIQDGNPHIDTIWGITDELMEKNRARLR